MYSDGLIELLNLNTMKKIWILIYVQRGFISEPEIFFAKNLAQKRKREILKIFNRDYDEIKMFEKYL